jgi:hypothetical protein
MAEGYAGVAVTLVLLAGTRLVVADAGAAGGAAPMVGPRPHGKVPCRKDSRQGGSSLALMTCK